MSPLLDDDDDDAVMVEVFCFHLTLQSQTHSNWWSEHTHTPTQSTYVTTRQRLIYSSRHSFPLFRTWHTCWGAVWANEHLCPWWFVLALPLLISGQPIIILHLSRLFLLLFIRFLCRVSPLPPPPSFSFHSNNITQNLWATLSSVLVLSWPESVPSDLTL